MNKITKDMCKRRLSVKLLLIIIILIGIFSTLLIGLANGIWWAVFSAVLFCAFDFYMLYLMAKGHLNNDDYYIVEDVFMNVQKNVFVHLNYLIRHRKPAYKCNVKFLQNGIYRILLVSKEEPKKMDADYFTVFFSTPGDKFYLLMSKKGNDEHIIKAFNTKHFKLVEEDFEYVDGKYYPKKV